MTKQTRTRRSEEEWRAIIRQYETAPEITADFFEQLGVHQSMIYKHRKDFKLKHPRGDPRNLAKLDGQPASPGTEVAVIPRTRKLSGRNHPPELREKAIVLYQQGVKNFSEIADRIGIPGKGPAVAYWIQTHKKGGGPKQQLIPAARGAPAPVHAEPAMGAGTKAAIILLKQMDREINRMIRANKIQTPDSAHLYGQLALRALTGDQ